MISVLQPYFLDEIISCTEISGYENANYLIETIKEKYILKTYLYSQETLDLIKAENDVLWHLHQNNFTKVPKPIAFNNHEYIVILKEKNKQIIIRLLTYLEGNLLGNEKINSEKLFSLGEFLATMQQKMKGFTHYVYKSRTWEWNIENLEINQKYLKYITNPSDQRVVNYYMQQFQEVVHPVKYNLPKNYIHNDANEFNLLTNGNKITGIIDFGDYTYTYQLSDIAVAIVYAVYHTDNYLENILPIIKAYHQIIPLTEIEIDVLYYFVAARLCISVCNAAFAKHNNPSNNHALLSEKNAWRMIHNWLKINPIYFSNSIKDSLKLETVKSPKISEVLADRHLTLPEILSVSYKTPLYLKKAAFTYMYDAYGNTFLDAYNNIPHVGHSHPSVVQANQKQSAILNTNTRYLYDAIHLYTQKLLTKFPKELSKVFLVNSGSEANDLAIRMAKKFTNKSKVMVLEQGYHGHTQTGIDISDYKFSNPKGQGQKDYIIKTAAPDTYRGKYTENNGKAAKLYVQDTIKETQNDKGNIAVFIAEPIIGCAGQVPLAKGYLKEMYAYIRNQGGVCISDEVQTGFGRLGDYFWGFEAHDVVPDIVVIGKPMGNGHPMGAVICTNEIANTFSQGVEFFTSFGGNPVSCQVGLAVLETIDKENLQENAKIVGNYYIESFKELQKKYPCIGDVRGSGLFIGIDIVKDGTNNPNTELASYIKNELRNQYVLVSTDGPFDNVIKTKPPLIFSKENVDEVIFKVDTILNNFYKKREFV
jgi:ethanolamine-phosphate phospho-lyase